MGKKSRKTRWRTLAISNDHSDSEESTGDGVHSQVKGYHATLHSHHHNNGAKSSYYGRFSTYSSQSTPIRRYNQYDGTKSTRSSSTASENKITFNEDEYTRITTPRQDVLFKKGYLNKPKTYQTQTSTGTSTTSTGNSTGNGTPDHQSTDLDYESQFVFPNGFVDQNGIYYVNSFEPYPLMVYNPPAYYQEVTDVKSKRYSTGSLTESASPNNEESSSGQEENPPSDFGPVYNVIYPSAIYYNNNETSNHSDSNNHGCQPTNSNNQDETNDSERSQSRSSSTEGDESCASSSSTDEVFNDTPAPPPNKDEAPSEAIGDTSELKPDAEEFVPRAYRCPETVPLDPPSNVQFIKLPPNFVPMPMLNPIGEFNAFVPINFVPHPINFIPPTTNGDYDAPEVVENENGDESVAPPTGHHEMSPEIPEVPKNRIDIAKIVSKLEEAAKEQENDDKRTEPVAKQPVHNQQQVSNDRQDLVRKRNGYVTNTRRGANFRKPKVTSPHHHHYAQQRQQHDNTQYDKKDEDRFNFNNVKKRTSPAPFNNFNNNTSKSRNYSETLKTTASVVVANGNCHHHHSHQSPIKNYISVNQVVDKKESKSIDPIKVLRPTAPNQWISVSNRKKRKSNRHLEENGDFDDALPVNDDEFEIYDVDLLKDVVIATENQPELDDKPIVDDVVVTVETAPITEELTAVKNAIDDDEVSEVANPKKKKAKNKKTPAHRVIIKDVDLSMAVVKETEAIVCEAETKPIEVDEITETAEVAVVVNGDAPEVTEPIRRDTPDKKSKKKKKAKVPKVTITATSEPTRSNSLTNLAEYDFLLETSILDDAAERTNVEVIQELDRLIRRGMYSNLEEKIRQQSVDQSTDEFFRDVIGNISTSSATVTPSIDTNQFAKMALKPAVTNQKAPMGFLGLTTPGGDPGVTVVTSSSDLYPITAAVKEWMTKTRETTPEVEIFKSPSAIYREFRETSENVDDDVTLFSMSREGSVEREGGATCDLPLDVYESKYGGNDDFRKIRAEVDGMSSHGDLPYRAICCSIM